MKLTISKIDFAKSLAFVQNIVETKTTIPILSNVLLEAKQGRLNLSATDMDITISDKVKIKNIEEEGSTSVPAHMLYNVIKELSDDKPIDLSYDKNLKKSLEVSVLIIVKDFIIESNSLLNCVNLDSNRFFIGKL